MARFPLGLVVSSSLFLLLSPAGSRHALADSVPGDGGAALAPRDRAWLEEISPLITSRERQTFLGLRTAAEKAAFVEAFWQARDPYPETPRNELREQWEVRLQEARRRWGSLGDDRARIFLLRGQPAASFPVECPGARPSEVWVYEPQFREKYRTALVFLAPESPGGPARLWHYGSAGFDPAAVQGGACGRGEGLARAAQWIHWEGKDGYEALLERALARPQAREWLSTFVPLSLAATDGDGAPKLAARLDVEPAGLWQDKVVIRVLLSVDARSLPAVRVAGVSGVRPADLRGQEDDFVLAGRVLSGSQPFESFLYRFHARPEAERPIPLSFERCLPPGRYVLEVKLEHVPSRSVFQESREIAVPSLAPAAADPARLFAEADAALSARRPFLRLLAPLGALLSGPVRFEARVDGTPEAAEQVRRVAFTLDGKPLLSRSKPPYELNVDLGPVPRPRKLVAEGLGEDGAVVARDEILVNAGAQPLHVRLREPRAGKPYRQSMRAVVDVDAPAGERVARVDLYLGEERVATLYQPPFVQPIALAQEGQVDYVRAVATLANGATAEDVVLINAPARPDAIDVRLVELYATVLDGQGRPVAASLDGGAFQVAEDGVPQQVRQVDPVAETPLRLVTLIDSSGSMFGRMPETRKAAREFLRKTLRPQDQAAVIAFNRAPKVVVPLTGDVGALEDGLDGVQAGDETALWDSLIYSVFYLGEAKGQRAVLLLSDGMDRVSRFRYEQAIECARRAGVAVYTIGLALDQGAKGEAAQRLAHLSEVTGGRAFFAADTKELAGVYGQIENELRARWRIAYQSTNTRTDGTFRAVQVKVAKGLEARTISGYYP
jgi:Ca-activated chloride channel homolog